ncbi:tRNA pseudouridine(55) synthase TruB, partial [Micromonospora humida]
MRWRAGWTRLAGLAVVNGDGLIVVDKPGGMTSHDVVARIRRLART